MSLLFSDLHRRRTMIEFANLGEGGYDKMVVVVAVASKGTACAWMVGCTSKFVGNPCSGLFASHVGEPRAKLVEELLQRHPIRARAWSENEASRKEKV